MQIGEALYGQWREVFNIVSVFAENLPDEEDERISTKNMIYENAYLIAPKILRASGDTLYQIKMENAAFIRFNCRQMWEQIAFAVLAGNADAEYKEVIEEALTRFKELIRKWVSTFKPDEYDDDWGLFILLSKGIFQPCFWRKYLAPGSVAASSISMIIVFSGFSIIRGVEKIQT